MNHNDAASKRGALLMTDDIKYIVDRWQQLQQQCKLIVHVIRSLASKLHYAT